MNRYTKRFSECEHEGDLQNYVDDIAKCGGKIISSKVIHDEEHEFTGEGTVTFEVEDKAKFDELFKETESYGF